MDDTVAYGSLTRDQLSSQFCDDVDRLPGDDGLTLAGSQDEVGSFPR